MPAVLQVMRQMKTAVGQRTALYGLVTGPLTLASHLRGTEIFMDLVDQPEYAQALLAYCRDGRSMRSSPCTSKPGWT